MAAYDLDSIRASAEMEPPQDLEHGHGHFFTKKTFHKPTYCHHCTDLLWGLIGQGYICEVCNFVVHDRCLKTVVSPCSSIAVNLIKNPVPHCWSEPGHFKRKFCNVCRKRLEDSWAIRCEICEYYAHLECQDFVVSDCKECATYIPNREIAQVVQLHHWREGNLPANSKCLLCKKTCWSAECLAGIRCEWCGVTAHAVCYKILPPECNFGSLQNIMLPPSGVTIPRTDLPMETILGVSISKQKALSPRSMSEEWSSSGDLKSATRDYDEYPTISSTGSTKDKDKDKDRDEELIKVFDGDSSLKRRQFRTITVMKSASAQQILEAALRTFHITDDPRKYYVTEVVDKAEGTERELDEQTPLRNLRRRDARRPAIFLRYNEKDPDRGYIKVYPGTLRVAVPYKNIPVTSNTSADQVISYALKKFGMDSAEPGDYKLVEVLLERGIQQRELTRDECPWQIMQQIRKESLHKMQVTRFYIQQVKDPHGPSISLFVGKLPESLSQRQYETILVKLLGNDLKYSTIGPIYYEFGSLVITYVNGERAVKAFGRLQEAMYDDKQLLVLLLPNIQAHMIPTHVLPLLVFVNVKSGGCQGLDLITSYRKLLNPHQVFDLDNGGPLAGLYVFRNIKKYKIMVCGGDGTVGWVLSCLDNVGQDSECPSPPCAIVPLGTGNDLARVLRWGPGYTGGEDPLNMLKDVIDAEEIRLDRWTVVFHPDEKPADDTKSLTSLGNSNPQNTEDTTSMFVMNNYFGIGLDADLCLDFHMAREENPDKFNSRLHNKTVYVKKSLRKMFNRKSCKDMQNQIRLEVDGRHVELPQLEGIIILNILSWASGANPWGPQKEDQFSKPNHYDGNLEVVGVTGVVHMGQIQSGLRGGVRIAQGGHIKIWLYNDLPVQVDGEPWIQSAGQVVVLRSALKATMLRKPKNKIKRRYTESEVTDKMSELSVVTGDDESM
ncbi:PREDICTED: diacylglycerol kinase theta-like isoform X2 [Priapulus caudatus]|uniref:Diacylglycerol kinase n=1 Tax=Priapulus caudatus TaxID=37621 RepID=A0ABM1E2W0_PRICU|nr:PREDICTED: diacylglycerol kinase theta-like isoform X2 [Priapulus caudatus]